MSTRKASSSAVLTMDSSWKIHLHDLIRKYEGLKLKAYLCPAGVWTIGWGTTGAHVKKGMKIDKATADRWMIEDADRFIIEALRYSPVLAAYPMKLCAIADFCYNLGGPRYRGSTLRKRINARDWESAAFQIQKWVYGDGKKLPGLIKRRAEEAILLLQKE